MEAWPAGPGPGSSGGGASGWGASRVGAPQRSSGSGGSGALWGAQPVLSSSGEAHAHAQRPGSGQRIGRWRVAQLAAVYAAITAHVFVMAYTDPLADPSFVQLLLLFRYEGAMRAVRRVHMHVPPSSFHQRFTTYAVLHQ